MPIPLTVESPRRRSTRILAASTSDTQANTRAMRALLAHELPQLGEREQLRIAAVLRCLVSTQSWLRIREEFGVPGIESGPVVAWVIDTIIREVRAGNTPTVPS